MPSGVGGSDRIVPARRSAGPHPPMRKLPEIHLAILTYDALDKTQACLESIRAHTRMPYRVHVWDNASKKDTKAWLREAEGIWDALDVRFSPTNRGVAGGRNELLNWLLPEIPADAWLVFLDNDITVGAGWTEPFEALLESVPDVGMMGHMGHPILVGEGHRALLAAPDRTAPVDVLSGGFACWIRAGLARTIGPLDEGTGKFWHEDDDWSVRVKAAGHTVWRVAGADITHHEHGSGVAEAGLAEGGSLENQAFLARKWRDAGWVDAEGWVQHKDPLHGLDRATRARIARRAHREAGLDRAEVGWVQGDLDLLLRHPDPATTPDMLGLPWTPLHTALLEEVSVQSRCATVRGRAGWLLAQTAVAKPEPTAQEPAPPGNPAPSPSIPAGPASPLRVCDPRDWHNEGFLRALDELRTPSMRGLTRHTLDRHDWEQAALLQALKQHRAVGANPATRSAVLYGFAYLPISYRVAQDFGLALVLDPAQHRKDGLGEDDPEPTIETALGDRAPFPYPKDQLRLLELDVNNLSMKPETFDVALCRLHGDTSPLENEQTLAHVASLVKPGGLVCCLVEVRVSGPDRNDASGLTLKEVQRDLVPASGLLGLPTPHGSSDVGQAADWEQLRPWWASREMAEAGRPHLVERTDNGDLTSALLVLHKPEHGWRAGTSSAARRRALAEPAPIQPLPRPNVLIPSDMGTADKAQPVHVGWDARTLQYLDSVSRGIGHYTIHHLEAVLGQAPGWRFTLFGEGQAPRILERLLQLPNASWCPLSQYRPGSVDLLHVPDPMNTLSGFDAPFRVFREDKTTALFHDLIPYHLYWRAWPEQLRDAYRARLQQMTDAGAIALTNSVFTGEDLVRTVGFPAERTVPVLAGLNASYGAPGASLEPDRRQRTLARYGLRGPFFLYVGAGELHKNLATSLGAFRDVCTTHDAQFVLAGRLQGQLKTLHQRCKDQGMTDVVATDFIPREELEDLYSAATATVFMSRLEGFGFPVLEAMARGCPVISSNAASLPEVGGDAVIQLDPDDEPGVAAAMRHLLDDPNLRHELAKRGRKRAAQFTWDAVALRTLETWRAMLAQHAHPSDHAAAGSPARLDPGQPAGT